MIASDWVWDMICQIVLWNVFLLLHLIDDFGKRLHLLLADVQNTTEPVIVEELFGFLFSNFFFSTHFVFAHQPMQSRSFQGKRILRYQARVMRAEMMMRAITMFTKSNITRFIPLAGMVHWCQYPWTSLEWQNMKMTTFKDVTSGTLCVKFYRPLAGPVQGTGWWGSKSWQSWPPSACPGSGKTKIFMVRWFRVRMSTTWNM